MKTRLFLLLSLVLLFTVACQKEYPPPKPIQHIEDGVIVWQEPLWKVPHDTTNYARSSLLKYWHFEDKVVVETHKDGKAGIRCVRFTTGEVLWEQYFQHENNPNGYGGFSLYECYFNPEEGYLIVMPLVNPGGFIKLDIHTGEIIWVAPYSSLIGFSAYKDHFYCSARNPIEYAVYRVDVVTGEGRFYYASDVPPLDYDPDVRVGADAFEYKGQEMLFVAHMQIKGPMQANYYFCLMYADTKEKLLTHIPIDSFIQSVEVYKGDIYVFTGKGYKIFNMESLSFEKEVNLIAEGEYDYHTFHEDKLIVGLTGYNDSKNGHYVVDIDNHECLYSIGGNIYPTVILDNILYLSAAGKFFEGYDLLTGEKRMQIAVRYDTTFGIAAHKDTQGKKFIVLSDTYYTYCFEGI